MRVDEGVVCPDARAMDLFSQVRRPDMPLSYKIVLGSVALLCLVVIGFKAVSGGEEDQPHPIAVSQPNHGVVPDATSDGTDVAEANTANRSDVTPTTTTPITDSTTSQGTDIASNTQPDSTVEAESGITETQDENLADITRALAADVTNSDDSTTNAAPEDDHSTTTQVADASNASQDSEDKGLDDLLSRIRQYEADVLADETNASAEGNVSDNADTVENFATVEGNSTTPATASTETLDLDNNPGINETVDTSASNEIIIPENPPVVTIGRGAPIQQLANVDTKSSVATTAGESESTDTKNDLTEVKLESSDTTNEENIAAAVFDPPVVIESKSAKVDEPANTDTSLPTVEPTITTTPNPLPQPGTYTIKPGDTFSSISVSVFGAERHWQAIADANPKVDSRRMRVGQVIKLPDLSATPATATSTKIDAVSDLPATTVTPAKDTHVVRAGESLWAIAKEHYGKGELWHHLYKSNRDVIGSKPGNVRAGMKLRIAALPANR